MGAAAAVALGWVVAAVLPLAWLAGGGRGPDGTLIALGTGSSVGMTLSAVLLILLVRRAWGAQVLASVARPVLLAVLGAGAVLVLRELAGGLGVDHWAVALTSAAVTGLAVLAAALGALRLGARPVYRDLVGGLGRRGAR